MIHHRLTTGIGGSFQLISGPAGQRVEIANELREALRVVPISGPTLISIGLKLMNFWKPTERYCFGMEIFVNLGRTDVLSAISVLRNSDSVTASLRYWKKREIRLDTNPQIPPAAPGVGVQP